MNLLCSLDVQKKKKKKKKRKPIFFFEVFDQHIATTNCYIHFNTNTLYFLCTSIQPQKKSF